jgi:hypothetical protein
MGTDVINPTFTRLCAWAGILWMVLFFLGFYYFANMLPPIPASLTANEVAEIYRSNSFGIRAGIALCIAVQACGFVWCGGMAAWTAKIEGGLPVMSFAQLVCAPWSFGGAYIGLVSWGVAAFRPDVSPPMIQMLNDTGWFWMCLVVSCSSTHAILMGLTILSDKRADPIFPRWMGYFQMWMGILQIQGALVVFFKAGPFAYHGLFGMWIPFAVFTAWVVVGTWGMLRATRRELAGQQGDAWRQGEPVALSAG